MSSKFQTQVILLYNISMENFETEPTPTETTEETKSLKDALAEFEKADSESRFKLQEGETITDYFAKHIKEPEITLIIQLPTKENLIQTASELRSAVFKYLKEYIETAFIDLGSEQKESAETDIRTALGEIVANVRHSEDTTQLHNLYVKINKIGDVALLIKLINPTSNNPKNFATRHGDEAFFHGAAITSAIIEKDQNSPVRISHHGFPITTEENQIVGHEDEIVIAPRDKVTQ